MQISDFEIVEGTAVPSTIATKKMDRVAYFAAITVNAIFWNGNRSANVVMFDAYESIDRPAFSYGLYVEHVADVLATLRPITVHAEKLVA